MVGGGGLAGGGMWGSGHVWGAMGTGVPTWVLVVCVTMQLLPLAVLVGAGYLVHRAVVGPGGDHTLEDSVSRMHVGTWSDEEYGRRREG